MNASISLWKCRGPARQARRKHKECRRMRCSAGPPPDWGRAMATTLLSLPATPLNAVKPPACVSRVAGRGQPVLERVRPKGAACPAPAKNPSNPATLHRPSQSVLQLGLSHGESRKVHDVVCGQWDMCCYRLVSTESMHVANFRSGERAL
ncbi:uncharacterized protein IWZ02DRAFT_169489 [Phyllosticta citriasiana]|uniref:uncharacterized protein n=1 Tax=Phyllosticta citriasiana TaxID=595635 RepID=UPI0030FD7754